MKYMTFNSSCAYAGLANLLTFCGIDTEDYLIAQEIAIPYCFAKEDGAYKAAQCCRANGGLNYTCTPEAFVLTRYGCPGSRLRTTLRRSPVRWWASEWKTAKSTLSYIPKPKRENCTF